jgi:hypothetical protein
MLPDLLNTFHGLAGDRKIMYTPISAMAPSVEVTGLLNLVGFSNDNHQLDRPPGSLI